MLAAVWLRVSAKQKEINQGVHSHDVYDLWGNEIEILDTVQQQSAPYIRSTPEGKYLFHATFFN